MCVHKHLLCAHFGERHPIVQVALIVQQHKLSRRPVPAAVLGVLLQLVLEALEALPVPVAVLAEVHLAKHVYVEFYGGRADDVGAEDARVEHRVQGVELRA